MVKRSSLYTTVITIFILIVFGLVLFSQRGFFAKTPTVTAIPDNCYEQTLVVITDEDYSPYSFYDKAGNPSGHDVELMIMIANEMKMNLDLRLMNWYEAIEAMDAGEADVLMTCDYSDSFEGLRELEKCEPVSFDDFIVYSKKKIKSSDELYGKRIGIMRNGNVSAPIKMMNLERYCIEYDDNRKAMQALIDDEVDCAVMRQTVGAVLLQELKAEEIEGYIGIGQSFMCFCVQNDETAGKINSSIETLKMNGELDRLHEKWLTTFIRPYTIKEVIQNNSWLVVAFISLVAVTVIVMLVSSFRTKKIEEERQNQLQQAYERLNIADRRNALLHQGIKASTWSYAISSDDEITAARYDSYVAANTSVKDEDDPMGWVNALHPSDKDRVLSEFMAAIRDHSGNTPYETTYRILDSDGKYMWAKTSGSLSRNEDGTAELIGISINITEQMEEQQKRLLGAVPMGPDILSKASIGLWSFEMDEGQPPRMYGDEAMIRLVGLDHQVAPEEMYHAWYDNIDPGSYDLVEDAVSKMTSGEHAEVQYPWHFSDGRTIIVRCGGIRNFEYTKGIRIEGTHQDVTQTLHFDEEERKREEQQKQDEIARIKAEASDKAKTEFLFNMSHDIRTPMNAILGYTDIALNHIDDLDRICDSLKKIKLSGGHLLNLINDILEMSRIEAGRLEIINAPLNIHEVSEGVIYMSQSLAASKNITFNASINELRNPYIYADELHTNQVIINLISNAVKYTNNGGTVEYSIEQISDPVEGFADYRVIVRDNGIGMSDEFQKHLFESFAREQTPTVSKQEGAGLGLAIVKNIVDLIGGTIRVHSKQGEGTTVIVELPLEVMDDEAIKEFEASRKSRKSAGADIDLSGKKVLLVEDNELNREIAIDILSDEGLVVEKAEDGTVAVDLLKEKGPEYYDFILMDIQMPKMDGYEAAKAIRKMYPNMSIPIIALSANAFAEDREKSILAGMDDHVAKPIKIDDLLRALTKYV